MAEPYDAVLIVSFGGPEGPAEILPFLENVLRGKNVPRERMLEVAQHYEQFGGISPINGQNRALIAALIEELNAQGPHLPVYWGNRNWHPMLPDALQQMADDGIRHSLALFTSAYSSYSGCRQYLEDIERAQQEVGSDAPQVSKLRSYYNHPGFVEPLVESVSRALSEIPESRRDAARIIYTAHSIPHSMAEGCAYEAQLKEACELVSSGVGRDAWDLVYQSRSGPPSQPWLEPDICDYLEKLGQEGNVRDVVILPIGFVSDHLEVLYDLDTEAQAACERLGLNMVRAATVGKHPRFIQMIRELIEERMTENPTRPALGKFGPVPDVCPAGCCMAPRRGRPS